MDVKKLQMYINGSWDDAADGECFDVFAPATGKVIATAPRAKQADVGRAVAAARKTFDDGNWWPRTSDRERGRILLRSAHIVRREADRLADLERLDSGKPIVEARADIEEAAFMLEYYGGWATKIDGHIPPVGPDGMSLVVQEPVGVVAGITPWNYPFAIAVQKLAPAVAAGCTLVLKPAEQTPFTALELPTIMEEAGLPSGVFHVVTGIGEEAGAALVEHPQVDKITFTGSREIGKVIMRNGAETLKRVTLELGGKSPNIVFADADFDAAIEGSCNGIFWNQGEICTAGSRVLVERAIYDDALNAMVERAKAVSLGDGRSEETTMGPLVSLAQQARVERYIQVGMEEARLAVMGKRPTDPHLAGGYFVPPTIFAEVDNKSTIAQEEIFGPVMSVIPFEGPEEATRLSNDTDYGLAAAVWSQDITKAISMARALRAGMVWINDTQASPTEAPFGGFKQSGFGRELGKAGVLDFTETKHIYINLASRGGWPG
jgi:acyl-CoA reductase-like NAD-dependent aldehyde dehydrogenase